jgi:hypothetical protein
MGLSGATQSTSFLAARSVGKNVRANVGIGQLGSSSGYLQNNTTQEPCHDHHLRLPLGA